MKSLKMKTCIVFLFLTLAMSKVQSQPWMTSGNNLDKLDRYVYLEVNEAGLSWDSPESSNTSTPFHFTNYYYDDSLFEFSFYNLPSSDYAKPDLGSNVDAFIEAFN
jgi:hypothetical protein